MRLLILLFGFIVFPLLAVADEVAPLFGLAMQGAPKYSAAMPHFDYVNPNAPQGGMLHLAASGSFDSLNPHSVRGNRVRGVSSDVNLIHESLMIRSADEPFSLYGLIAQSVRVADDRSWIEFTLNPAAHWNNGAPITVDDVLYSWQILRDKGRPNHRSYYKKVLKAEATAPQSVRFTFDTAQGIDREMPLIIGLMPVLCKAWWEKHDVSAPSMDIPISSGPYLIEKVDTGRSITYRRDPHYWGKDLAVNRGLWNFERVRYDYYRDDSVALEAFKSGGYDLRREQDPIKWRYGYSDINLQNITLLEEPNARPEPARGFIFNTRRPLFADFRVRRALTLAFDFEWANRALFAGLYRRTASLFPNSELAATGLPDGAERAALEPFRDQLDPEIFTKPILMPTTEGTGQAGQRQNLAEALALFNAAGYQLQKGVMQKEGKPFRFTILLGNAEDEKIALEYRRSLKRLGIEVELRTVDSAQFQARLNSFDYDMTVNFWASSLSPGNEQLYYWGSLAADQQGSRNYAGVKSNVVDALASTLNNTPTRQEFVGRVKALDRVLMNGYYFVPLAYLGRDLVAYRTGLGHPDTPLYGVQPEQTWYWRNPAEHRK